MYMVLRVNEIAFRSPSNVLMVIRKRCFNMGTAIENLVGKIISNGGLDASAALEYAENMPLDELLEAARSVMHRCCPKTFDTCSIINAKSGKCPEDCRWCAQSAHHKTGTDEYPLLSADRLLEAARLCKSKGIGRFSIVTSGRRLRPDEVEDICRAAETIGKNCGIYMCLSAGLLSKDDLARLHEAGIRRYHCNLETAPSFFPSLCTTHTQEQKLSTLEAARDVGMEICSGGIIGMGETMAQRIELAAVLKGLGVQSVPVNILSPIKGTALESQPLISEDEILRTIAIFRLMMPHARLRFAGGRARLSEATLMKAFRSGINAAIIGDMLTTVGADVSTDMHRIKAAGYVLSDPSETEAWHQAASEY